MEGWRGGWRGEGVEASWRGGRGGVVVEGGGGGLWVVRLFSVRRCCAVRCGAVTVRCGTVKLYC